MEFCELEGDELDIAVAKALGFDVTPTYTEGTVRVEHGDALFTGYIGGDTHQPQWRPSKDWSIAGPLIDRFQIHLSGPESRVHRNGGPNAGWGQSGMWTATSWKLRNAEGRRGLGYHDTSMLIAAMRLIVWCHTTTQPEAIRHA